MPFILPRQRKLTLSIVAVLAAAASTSACNPVQDSGQVFKETFNNDDPCSNNARNIGAVVGGIAGLLIGRNNSNSAGAIALATAAGAGIGALIGNDIDSRRCELYKISKKYDIPIQSENITAAEVGIENSTTATNSTKQESVGLKVSLQDTGKQFESGSDQLTPAAKQYFTDIAKTYSPNAIATKDDKQRQQQIQLLQQKQILLIGHTDDTGSSNFNAELAEKRAKVVAELFAANGVPRDNLHYQGAGETQPIADNRTEAGRAKNRRAEIIELPSQKALQTYLAQRKPVLAFYRNVPQQAFIKPKTNADNIVATTSVKGKTRQEAKPIVATPPKKESLPPAQAVSSVWHFNGQKVTANNSVISVGEVISAKDKLAWVSSLIGTANASSSEDSVYASTCLSDHPRATRGVKSLATGKEISTSEYLPGLNNTVWMGDAGQHRIALSGVSVLRDGGLPVKNPDVRIYATNVINASSQPLAKPSVEVNAYRGQEGVLYRVFMVNNSTPVDCIDIALPNKAPFDANAGYVIYEEGKQPYSTVFKPSKL